MYGQYELPFQIDDSDFCIRAEKQNTQWVYFRESQLQKVEKRFLLETGKIRISPVEPLLQPKELTPYLMIVFEQTLFVAPKINQTIFLKFPIDIGVYVTTGDDYSIIDCFTMVKPKFTLYGDPHNGALCKFWKSEIFDTMPEADPYREGVIKLNIKNLTTSWVSLTRAVFNAYGMKIFFNDRLVGMTAEMRLRSTEIAETAFEDAPVESGMQRFIEYYTSKKLSIQSTRFVMELGI